MEAHQWQPGEIIAAGSFLLAVLVAAVSLYRYLRRGPKLVVEIFPPRRNRKNKKDTDRIITVAVTNHGDRPANIWKLRLRTIESRFTLGRKIVDEATFDDSTPWKPTARIEPFDTKTYDLQFFEGWTKSSSPSLKIEVAAFIRANEKPAISRTWG